MSITGKIIQQNPGIVGSLEENEPIQGKLNQQAKLIGYKGGVTNTATVNITDNLITVDARIDVDKIEAKYAEILERAQQVENYYKATIEEISKYEDRFAALQTEINNNAKAISSQGVKLDKLQIDISSLNTKIDTVKLDLNKVIDSKIAVLKSEVKADKAQLEAKIAQNKNLLESEIEQVSLKVDDLEQRLHSIIEESLVEIKKDLVSLNLEVANIKADFNTRITANTKDIVSLKGNVISINSKISQLAQKEAADIAELNSRVDNISDTILPLIESKIKELSDKVDAKLTVISQEIANLDRNLSAKINTLNSTLTYKINTLSATVDSKLLNLSKEVDNKLEGFDEKVDTKLEALSKEVDTKTKAVEDKLDNKVDISTYNKEIASLEKTLEKKGGAMYFDNDGEFDPSHQGKQYWYMVADINYPTETIIAGPYNFGTGGGGGGGGGTVTTEVHIDAVNWPSTISLGSECKLQIVWTSTREGTPTGNGRLAVYVDEALVYTQKNVIQGFVTVDMTDYIKEGTHSIEFRVTDAYSNMNKVIQELTAVDIKLTSLFNADRVLTGVFNYIYTPNGANLEKTTHFILDGKQIGTQKTKLSSEQQTYPIGPLTHGSHSLKVYFDCVIDGNLVKSNELNYDLIYEVAGNTTPIIASTFNAFQQEQYIAFNIPYRVYTPGHAQSNIKLYVNDILETSLSVNQDTQYWEYRPNEAGDYKFEIVCETVRKTFNINVKESEIKVQAVEQDLALYLNTIGKNNADLEHREIWEDKDRGISCELTGFNFVSDGWLLDNDGNTVLRVTGDARVRIPYQIFKDDFKIYGKTIELELSTNDVRDYETTILSCLDAGDSFSKKCIILDLDGRTKKYQIESFDDVVFKEKVKDAGKYLFIYNGSDWTLNDIPVNLKEYGIVISEVIIEMLENDDSHFVLPGDQISVEYSIQGRGIYVTPQIARIRSQQSELFTQYKEEEHVRLTFVVEKTVETHMILMYINGIMSGAVQYPINDSFRQKTPVDITIGSNDATTNIYCIRVYDNNLNRKQVVNNWIADTQSGKLKTERYLHNDNYNEAGELVISKLPGDLPHIIWDIDPLPQFKGDKRKGQAYYVDPTNHAKDFTLPTKEGVGQGDYNVQGTSSSVYPVKNIRLKSKEGFIDNDLKVNKLFYITEGGIGANYFTFKVDYASSEGANNVELIRLYNDAAKSVGILNPAQRLDNKVRVGIDGFPIIAFHRDASGKDTFCTKANFNNDKANEDVYGFVEGDESWEITNNSADEGNFRKPATPDTFANAFEIRFPDEDGYSDLSKLGPMTEWVVSTDPLQATNEVLAEPIQFTYKTVIRSEDGTYSERTIVSPEFTNDTAEYRTTKFKAELKDWFDVDSTIFYYIFTHLYLMVDSRAKNAFPTYFVARQFDPDGNPTDGGNRWFWLPYDMDTALGINNEGKLVFDYNLEDTDKFEGADVFNGQQSVMWNNLRKMFDGEIGQMYSDLRKSGSLISYEETEKRFDAHQAKWSETIFNEDSYQKYIVPLIEKGDNYLEMLQGSKAQQRKWWLYNRFKYFDSKYLAGEAKSDIMQFRAYGKADITLTPYADIYATVSYANAAGAVVSVRAERGKSYVIPNPLPASASDQETYIYSASQLKSVGDLSPFKPDTVKAANAIRLQDLKVGDDSIVEAVPAVALKTTDTEVKAETRYYTKSEEAKYVPGYLVDKDGYKYTYVENPVTIDIGKYYNMSEYGTNAGLYENPNLRELTLGKNVLLKTLNVKNCTSLTMPIDISGCTNIEEVYFDGTKITGIQLPSGGVLRRLHLPDTLTNLTIKNQKLLTDLEIAGTGKITTLWLENIPGEVIDARAFVSEMSSGSEIRLMGFRQEVASVEELRSLYNLFDTMHGLDYEGQYVEKAQVNGIIHINTIKYSEWVELSARYTDIVIDADVIVCKVDFYNDAIVGDYKLYQTQNVNMGSDAEKPEDPSRIPTAEFWYEFKGWDKSLENIQSDISIYSIYEAHDQEYEITFDLQSQIPEPIPSQIVKYGETASDPNTYELLTEEPEDWEERKTVKYYKYEYHISTKGKYVHCSQDDEYAEDTYYQVISPAIEGTIFRGWFNSPNCLASDEYDFDLPIEANKVLYAGWLDFTNPVVSIERLSATVFHARIEDNVALTAYGFSDSIDTEPEWITVEPSTKIEIDKEIDRAGNWVVWGKDAAEHVGYNIITAYTTNIDLTPGIEIIITEDEKVITSPYILQSTEVTVDSINDEHYEDFRFFINNLETILPTSIIIEDNLLIKGICNPKVYTITFDTNGIGKPVESQNIIYLHKVVQPNNQYDDITRKVITGWYLDNNTFTQRWDFDSDVVTGDTILYAEWELYTDPTVITIKVELEKDKDGNDIPLEVECHAYQSVYYGISVNWDDGTPEWTTVGMGYIDGKHTYTESGTYKVKFTCSKGTYSIGGGSSGKSVISPASLITDVFFAWNMPETRANALQGAVNLKAVEISPYMTKLAAFMFYGCTGLTSVTIPRNIIDIDNSAFQNCSSLTGTIVIPDSVQNIGNNAFSNCNNVEYFDLPDSISSIGSQAFSYCSGLRAFDFPTNLTRLEDWLFAGCLGFNYLDIPEQINYLGSNVFNGCSNLQTLIFRSSNMDVYAQGTLALNIFAGCAKLISAGNIGSEANLQFDWTEIPPRFFENSHITTINFDHSLELISNDAFNHCAYLKIVQLPEGFKKLGIGAFEFCTELTTINIPNSIEYISKFAFDHTGVYQIEIPENSRGNLITIEEQAFSNCGNLRNITISNSVLTIGANAFINCIALSSVKLYNTNSAYKVNTPTLSWFYHCPENCTIHIRKDISGEEAVNRFGLAWNFWSDEQQLKNILSDLEDQFYGN